jgi:hypothetical protein
MLTDYVIDDTMIGAVLPVANGFVVNLTRTKAGPYDLAQWDEGRGVWKAGRLVLRGSRDIRDLICIDTQGGGGWASSWGHRDGVLANRSVPYAGELMVVCVPRGSIWELTLSDQPYVKPPPSWPLVGPKVIDQHRGAKETARRARAVMDAKRAPV